MTLLQIYFSCFSLYTAAVYACSFIFTVHKWTLTVFPYTIYYFLLFLLSLINTLNDLTQCRRVIC